MRGMGARAVKKNEAARVEDATPNILLVGLRGSGKSTVGPLLAESLQHQFIDLDLVTLWRLRCATVAEAWRELGVPRFRAAEVEGLAAALDNPERVIAAGGGTPTAPGAPELIRAHQKCGDVIVIYLRGDPETLRDRIGVNESDDNRPSLTGAGSADEMDEVFRSRDPLYRELADEVITVDSRSPGEIVDVIRSRVRARRSSLGEPT